MFRMFRPCSAMFYCKSMMFPMYLVFLPVDVREG